MIHYGFNLLNMFVFYGKPPAVMDGKELDFIAKHGFNFIRIPTDYNFWTKDFDYLHPDESVFEKIDKYFEACRARGLHFSLNLHRRPGIA
jgi:aryl-phospho-beta-D-glucosidase BglC (GH1 family)